MYFESPNRNTGRTTRMLDKAIELARADRYVIVYAQDENYASIFQRTVQLKLTDDELKRRGGAGKVYCGSKGSISFVSVNCSSFDWRTMRQRGAHPSCVTMVDHRAIEVNFAQILKMYHMFDPIYEAKPAATSDSHSP